MTETSRPSVGRIVHYVSHGTPGGEYKSQCRAAIVTEVSPESSSVGLAVLNPTGVFFNVAPYHDGEESPLTSLSQEPSALPYPGGTWHWPERV